MADVQGGTKFFSDYTEVNDDMLRFRDISI